MADSDELDEGWGDDPVEKVPAKPASSPRAAAPASAPRSRDARATLPPPMPEQEYIEKILATEEEQAASKPPRQRLNTLIERDPLKYDAAPVADENTRPTKPPGSAVAAGSGGDDFLDLSLGELSGDRSSAPEVGSLTTPPAAAIPPAPIPPSATSAAAIPPPAKAPVAKGPPAIPPPARPALDSFDDLPIGDVLESIPPGSLSGRALGSASVPPPASVRPGPARPPPPGASAPQAPPPARLPYDSSPTIEVMEVGSVPISPTPSPVAAKAVVPDAPRPPSAAPATSAAAVARPAAPRAGKPTAPRPSADPGKAVDANPEKNRPTAPAMQAARSEDSPAAGKPAPARAASSPVNEALHTSFTPAKGVARASATGRPPGGAVTPAAGTKGPHLGSGPPGARTTDRPTRALRTPVGSKGLVPALEKVVERFEAGDFGRALMLAEQSIENGDKDEDLQHYAELCREKLRQTYVERIGTGRTILRVTVDPEKLRDRALDPRLAFLLSLLDGASSIDDVVDMSTMPPLEAVRALHELLQEGVVEVVEPGRRLSAQ